MLGVKGLVERLRLFVRDRFPLELKVLGLAIYFQTSILRRTARVLSECCRVSKTAVWKWVFKLRQKLSIAFDRKPRRFIALDETCVCVNGENYWVYSAIDVESNEIVHMRVYSSPNNI